MSIATAATTYAPTEGDAASVLRAALSRGGDWAELFWERHHTLSLLFDDGQLEEAVSGTDQGAGIRVERGDRTIYANANVSDLDDLRALAGRAAASVASEGAAGVPASPGDRQSAEAVRARGEAASGEVMTLVQQRLDRASPVEIDPRDVPLERKVALLEAANAATRAHDRRIEQVTLAYRESVQDVVVASSDGGFAVDRRIRLVFAANAVARDGKLQQTGYESLGGSTGYETMTTEAVLEVARAAARRAILNLEAEPAPAGTFAVVLSSEAGGTLIHESVGHGLEADLNDRGLSVYANKIGQKVASELITVVDDGRLPGKRGTATVDDEGTPTQRTVLIEGGVLRTYMSDRKHARKLGIPRSGNGRRQSFRHLPICRMTNTMVVPGTSDPESILRSVKEGIFVRKMGGGQVDVVSGDFAFEINEGYLIRDGRLAGAIRGATLTGHGPTVMTQVDMVGSDLGFMIGTCGKDGQGAPISSALPTLRIPAIVIGGIAREST